MSWLVLSVIVLLPVSEALSVAQLALGYVDYSLVEKSAGHAETATKPSAAP